MYRLLRFTLLAVALVALATGVAVTTWGTGTADAVSANGTHNPRLSDGSGHEGHGQQGDGHAEKALALHDAMRKLWEDHITWTRLFIVSDVAGLPDLDATTARLLQDQADIGDAIKPYYGEAAGNQLTILLREHILIAADVLNAAKAGDSAKLAQSQAAWYANAQDIAQFLTSANPRNWPLSETSQMMKTHLDLTLAEAVAHLQGNFAADVAAYDQVHLEILQMADMLSSGIAAQFPGQFH